MKRFLLFAGTNDPRGGWGDFENSFDTHPEALAAAEGLMNQTGLAAGAIPDWWHIVDSESGSIVQNSN